MKARINKDHQLELLRAGLWAFQLCPYNEGASRCDDSCPLLFECEPSTTIPRGRRHLALRCARDHTVFELVEDLRERPEKRGKKRKP